MASTKTVEAKISIKVLVDKEKNEVVYAEADHNFVDILFSFMTLPMGTIVRLLKTQEDKKFEALGSLSNLYRSLIDLPGNYFSSEERKFTLLNPSSALYEEYQKLKLNINITEPTKYFICSHHSPYRLSACKVAKCSKCCLLMDREVPVKYSTDDDGGVFVSEMSTYIVTNDLRVMPYTRILLSISYGCRNHWRKPFTGDNDRYWSGAGSSSSKTGTVNQFSINLFGSA